MKAILTILFFWALSAQAQNKTEKTIYDIKRTQGNLEEVKNIGQGLKGLLPKKKAKAKKKADTVKVEVTPPTVKVVEPTTAKKTIITIIGLDFSRLKTLNENIRACTKVESATIKFDPKESFIEVSHSGTTEDLLKVIQATSSEIFTEKNIAAFSEGSVTLKI